MAFRATMSIGQTFVNRGREETVTDDINIIAEWDPFPDESACKPFEYAPFDIDDYQKMLADLEPKEFPPGTFLEEELTAEEKRFSRRCRVAELMWIENLTGVEIAKKLGVAPTTISRDKAAIYADPFAYI